MRRSRMARARWVASCAASSSPSAFPRVRRLRRGPSPARVRRRALSRRHRPDARARLRALIGATTVRRMGAAAAVRDPGRAVSRRPGRRARGARPGRGRRRAGRGAARAAAATRRRRARACEPEVLRERAWPSRCSRSARRRGAVEQRGAILDGVRSGRSRSCSIHSATDSCYGWDEYGALVGARFDGHPWTQTFTADVLDPDASRVRAPRRGVAAGTTRCTSSAICVPTRRCCCACATASSTSPRPARAPPAFGYPLAWCFAEGAGRGVLHQPRPLPVGVGDARVPQPSRGRPRLGAGRVTAGAQLLRLGVLAPAPRNRRRVGSVSRR